MSEHYICHSCPAPQPAFTKKDKTNILDRLAWSDMFETFLANKWVTSRVGALPPASDLFGWLRAIMDGATNLGMCS